MASPRVEQSGSDVLLWIKAVPGASRAGALSIKPRQVSIESGQASPEKIVRVRGMTALDVLHRLGFSDQLRSD